MAVPRYTFPADCSPRIAADGDYVAGADYAALQSQNAELRRENDFMRAHTGNSATSCVYCGLGANEQGKCASGFPGCARADDQMLCREACVAMERDGLREALTSIVDGVRKFLADTSRPGYQSSSVAVVQAESVVEICAEVAAAALAKVQS